MLPQIPNLSGKAMGLCPAAVANAIIIDRIAMYICMMDTGQQLD